MGGQPILVAGLLISTGGFVFLTSVSGHGDYTSHACRRAAAGCPSVDAAILDMPVSRVSWARSNDPRSRPFNPTPRRNRAIR
jgi:hypothetical protein